MKLETGRKYDVDALQFAGWTEGDGTGHEGYNMHDYFADGAYLGPDMHGIEPIFRPVTASLRGPAEREETKTYTIYLSDSHGELSLASAPFECADQSEADAVAADMRAADANPNHSYHAALADEPIEAVAERIGGQVA